MLNIKLKSWLRVCCILVLASSFAKANPVDSADEVYFSVRETALTEPEVPKSSWQGQFIWQEIEDIVYSGARVYALLNFESHRGHYGNVAEPYNRKKHFGAWISPQDGDCRNTRALVLTRDSAVPVEMNSNGCTVASGFWRDPYSGRDFTQAADIQVDHVVPLKNAYISGADQWASKRRCLYANFLGNGFHLMPVLGSENMKKSDKTPAGYMPPDGAYACQYLANWLKIKLIWQLELSTSEKTAIENLAKQNQCSLAILSYSDRDLDAQRQFIADKKDLCH